MPRCPGQDQRFWKPEDIFEVKCPGCGTSVEFFKDEPKLKCRQCGHEVSNPRIDLGCVQWCQYAEQCLGVSTGKQSNIMCDNLINEMKDVFGDDQKRIMHALLVLKYAEKIQAAKGGDPLVVKAAAILHDIGIHEAEKKHGSPAGIHQEAEGPAIAKSILEKYEISGDDVEHICRIVGSHHTGNDIDTKEFRVVWDADWLVNIPDEFSEENKEKLRRIIDKVFKTDTGHQIAIELFLEK